MCNLCGQSPVVYRAERRNTEFHWELAICRKCVTRIVGEEFMSVHILSLIPIRRSVWEGY